VDSFTAVLNIDENCDVVYFPDAFTPNNDGKNDVFRPSYNYAITDFDWRIFNRWGQKVFASDDMTKAWDGTVGGIPQATGTFVWVVSYKLASGDRVSRKGTVVLIR
jgi:gliding motility-associated-like protein